MVGDAGDVVRLSRVQVLDQVIVEPPFPEDVAGHIHLNDRVHLRIGIVPPVGRIAPGREALVGRDRLVGDVERRIRAELRVVDANEIMVREIEPCLGIEKPVFLYDYPAERGALARLKKEDPALAERFELYVGGIEIANAFSELTDAQEQRERFSAEEASRREKKKSPYSMPEKFLMELEGMPPSAGIALGIDRLVMVFLDAKSIDEVVAFTPEEL